MRSKLTGWIVGGLLRVRWTSLADRVKSGVFAGGVLLRIHGDHRQHLTNNH